jgi:SAM-dependent methyltransferase
MTWDSAATPRTPSPPIQIPPEAIYYLLLQRSRYRFQPLYRLFSLVGAGGFYKQRITRSWVEAVRAPEIGRRYAQDLRRTVDQISPFLLDPPRATLDIGGGIGGLSLALWQRFSDSIERLHLLDRTEVTPRYHAGFRDSAAFYNSQRVAQEFLSMNGVPDSVVHVSEAGRDPFPEGPLDLVVSTLAWGYHFPVSTYLDAVHRALSPRGVVVLHLRKGTDGEASLASRFRSLTWIEEGKKSGLVAAREPIQVAERL